MTTWRTFWRSSLAASALMTMIGATAADRAEAAGEPVAGAGAVEAEVVSEEADARGLDLEIYLDPQVAFAFADDVSDEEAFREADDRPIDEQEAGAKLLDLARVKQRIAALAEREEAVAAEQLAKIQMELARTKERLAKEQAQLSQQVQALMEQVQSEAEQARHGLAEQVAKRVQQMRQLQVDDPFTLDATDEASGRADHLLQAAEELRAIGKTELADKLMEEAKRAAAAASTARPGGPAHPPMPTRPQAAPGAPEPPPRPRAEGTLRFEVRPPGVQGIEFQGPHFDQEIREEAVDLPAPEVERLREEMNELRSQVNDMREMLKRVVNRLERDQTAEQVK